MRWALIDQSTGMVQAKGQGANIVSPPEQDGCYLIDDYPDWITPGLHRLENGQFVEDRDAVARRVRSDRDVALSLYVDPVVTNPLRWADLSEAQQNDIVVYRKALLDLPEQEGFPFDVVWPEKPKWN